MFRFLLNLIFPGRNGFEGSTSSGARTLVLPEKRRGPRVPASLPVFVYGSSNGRPFAETSETLNISAYGGLFLLNIDVVCSQTLILTNLRTQQDLACRVTRVARNTGLPALVAVEFLQSSRRFWNVDLDSLERA